VPHVDVTTEMRVVAGAEDIGPIGYVVDEAYLRWVQTVVLMHWERFAPAEARASTLWVAVRHGIQYHAPAARGDHITARTAIRRLRGVRAVFSTVFGREDTVLAEIESTWVCIDRASLSPKAIDPQVLAVFE